MEEYLKEALEIVKAQAGVRNMTEEEIISMVETVARGISGLEEGAGAPGVPEPLEDPAKAIKEKSVTCLECGKSFRILTRRHLASHDITPEEYRDKWGYAKGLPLVCKHLQRERRKKMKDMKLWEKRKGS